GRPARAARDRLRLRLRDALPRAVLLDADCVEHHVPHLGPGLGEGACDVSAAAVSEIQRAPAEGPAPGGPRGSRPRRVTGWQAPRALVAQTVPVVAELQPHQAARDRRAE